MLGLLLLLTASVAAAAAATDEDGVRLSGRPTIEFSHLTTPYVFNPPVGIFFFWREYFFTMFVCSLGGGWEGCCVIFRLGSWPSIRSLGLLPINPRRRVGWLAVSKKRLESGYEEAHELIGWFVVARRSNGVGMSWMRFAPQHDVAVLNANASAHVSPLEGMLGWLGLRLEGTVHTYNLPSPPFLHVFMLGNLMFLDGNYSFVVVVLCVLLVFSRQRCFLLGSVRG